jgi:molybdate transport system substrate-binding protein
MRGRGLAAAAWTTALAVAAGCGSGSGDPGTAGSTGDRPEPVTVYAAASLAGVLPELAPDAAVSLAGSDRAAFQIAQGAPADVFLSAGSEHTDRLFARGLLERPVVFARNTLVLVTPSANPAGISSAADLTRPGVRLVIGTASVPVGAYARRLLRRAGLGRALANVVSEETDVRGVVAKVALGEADAGIVYRTDVADGVRSLPLPARAQPGVVYTAAATSASRRPEAARAFVRVLIGPRGRALLRRAGFLPGG